VRQSTRELFVLIFIISLCLSGCTRNIIDVTLNIPTEARIKLDNIETVAVLDFLATETQFHPGKEAAKQLRLELQNQLNVQVKSAEETEEAVEKIQTEVEGKVMKQGEYFQEIARALGVDAIIGGNIIFTSKDTSGYERQEFINERTGRPYYRDVWVEKLSLDVEMEAWFFRTADGEFLFNDKFKDETIIERESSSTSIYGFFDMIENQVNKLISHLAPQFRAEKRYLLR